MATPADTFEKLESSIKENPEKARSLDSIFQFDISGDDGGKWYLDLRQSSDEEPVGEGEHDDADVTISLSDEDWVGIIDGKVNPMQAFMMGKIKVKGNMGLAMKLQNIFSLAK